MGGRVGGKGCGSNDAGPWRVCAENRLPHSAGSSSVWRPWAHSSAPRTREPCLRRFQSRASDRGAGHCPAMPITVGQPLSRRRRGHGGAAAPAASLSQAAIGPADAEEPLRPALPVSLSLAHVEVVHIHRLLEPLLRSAGRNVGAGSPAGRFRIRAGGEGGLAARTREGQRNLKPGLAILFR